MPLPREYADNALRHGFPYFGQGETINVDSYSCPHCGASDRERLYALYLKEAITSMPKGKKQRLLHFSPELALGSFIRHTGRFDYRSADLSSPNVDDQIDICRMAKYPTASFDAFICSHVLEHVTDDRAALGELFRILKPGGWGILMVPLLTQIKASVEDPSATSEAARWRLFGQGDHVRLYAKQDFLLRIAAAKFNLKALGEQHIGTRYFERCGFKPGSTLYIVSHD